ncbi:MAG: CHRD domain-containing protein [Burkholderiales bacterium]|nr:CHRD domain-containing protein [Burkholderiales bacterium]
MALLGLALSAALPAAAHIEVFTTSMSGPAEFPANTSPGTGASTVTMDFDALTMRVQASFSGLQGNTIAAHIHCCVPPPPANPTAGVATILPSFTNFPLAVQLGDYDFTYDLAAASTYSSGFLNNAQNGGSVANAMNTLAAAMRAGNLAYFNIHTTSFNGGEIRGFLAPVPEPQTYPLMAAGLGLVGWAAARRRVRPA